jgi:hypothetical protein
VTIATGRLSRLTAWKAMQIAASEDESRGLSYHI